MQKTTGILGGAVLFVFLMQGCSHWVEEQAEDTVVLRGTLFEPREFQTESGTTVTWVNDSGFNHTVTSDEGLFESGVLEDGDQFTYTFDGPGEYPYHCEFHEEQGMTGTIIVGEQ